MKKDEGDTASECGPGQCSNPTAEPVGISANVPIANAFGTWHPVLEEPPANARIIATDGHIMYIGTYYMESGKFSLDDGIRFEEFGSYHDLEDNYTHWMHAPTTP